MRAYLDGRVCRDLQPDGHRKRPPDVDRHNGDDVAQNSEIGPVVTPFNISGVSNRVADPDIQRPYQWEYNAGVQRELRPRRLGVGQLGPPRLQADLLVRQHPRRLERLQRRQHPEPLRPGRPATLDARGAALCEGVAAGSTIPIYNLDVSKRGPGPASGQELRQQLQEVQRRRLRVHARAPAAVTSTAASRSANRLQNTATSKIRTASGSATRASSTSPTS